MRLALIGSRKAPRKILSLASMLGKAFSDAGHEGLSGGAPGMDVYFMQHFHKPRSRIIIPYNGFNNHWKSDPSVYVWGDLDNHSKIRSVCHAKSVTSYWDDCSDIVRTLFSRNAMQVLDLGCVNPVDVVFYWAPENRYGRVSGGTRVAVDIARKFKIPTFNLANDNIRESLELKYNLKQFDIFSL